jgi:hypothetical protein
MSLLPVISTFYAKKLPRRRVRLVVIATVVASCLTAMPAVATDLRGRVEAKPGNPVTVELRSAKPPHESIRKAVADREGRYYLADVPPGQYELVVNGVTFPVAVEQMAIQDLPPIRLGSVPPPHG